MAKPGPMEGMKKARPDQSNPRSEKGGPLKGLNPVYRVKKAGGEVSNTARHEPGPPSLRPLGHMIRSGHPKDFNVQRGNLASTRLRPRAQAEAEVRTGREQLPKGPAGKGNLSRRHTKQAKRQAEPEGLRQPNHQPQ